MVITISVDTRQLGRFHRLTGPELAKRAAMAVDETAAKIASMAVRDAPRDTGALAASITWDTWGTPNNVWGRVFSPLPYALAMEYGRKPGGPMPPKGELLRWMARHDIPESAEDAIRRKIAIKGIAPRPFLRPALAAHEAYFVAALRRHMFGA